MILLVSHPTNPPP